ncbi:hypothetical protein GCM10017673_43430 [Streptosporangium violaceochromogenes]|nr:hypothetical protein GCM10017673_43430 [Streptosporangium violaceochromogenes]
MAPLIVTTGQLVHAALWLVLCFGALAGGVVATFSVAPQVVPDPLPVTFIAPG